LLSGGELPALLRKPGSQGEMVRTAQDITTSLRRTRQALVEQLDHTATNAAVMGKGRPHLTVVAEAL
jgi:hypothetical protein